MERTDLCGRGAQPSITFINECHISIMFSLMVLQYWRFNYNVIITIIFYLIPFKFATFNVKPFPGSTRLQIQMHGWIQEFLFTFFSVARGFRQKKSGLGGVITLLLHFWFLITTHMLLLTYTRKGNTSRRKILRRSAQFSTGAPTSLRLGDPNCILPQTRHITPVCEVSTVF